MLNDRLRLGATVVTFCLAFTTSGCSLLNPYVRATQLDGTDDGAAGLPASDKQHNKALVGAITAAAAQRRAYYGAVSERAKLRNGLPLVLVPLGAAALYKGLVNTGGEATRRVLLKEGLVGASLYGLDGYYTSTARERTYLAGAKALSCSIYAMTPYYLPDDIAARISTGNVEVLNRQLALVRGKTKQVRAYADAPGTDTATRASVLALVTRAEASIAAAAVVLRRAVETQAALDDAGARLRTTVENIVSEVNEQIARTEPDLSAILMIVAGLPASAKQFAPGGTFSAATQEAAKSLGVAVTEATRPIDELPGQVNLLDQQVATVQFGLDVIAQRVKTTSALDTCKVQVAQGSLDMSSEDSVEMKVGQTRQFVIRSTAGIPTVEWSGTIHPQVDMAKSYVGETMIVQVAYKAAVEGITQVTLQAATRELKKQVTIELSPAGVPKATPGADAGTGKVGTANPTAVTANPSFDAPTAAVPIIVLTGMAGAKNAFEAGLKAERLKALQAKLNVAQTGALDPPTRAAIQQWQKDHNQSPPNGELQREASLAAMLE